MEIRRYAHGEGDFWYRMGPFLVSAEVRRELGVPITSDGETVWWLAIDDQDRVAGFVAARRRGRVIELRHDYVVPTMRRQGVYRALFEARLAECATWPAPIARATVNVRCLAVYLAHGFKEVGQRGQYTTVEKEMGNREPI